MSMTLDELKSYLAAGKRIAEAATKGWRQVGNRVLDEDGISVTCNCESECGPCAANRRFIADARARVPQLTAIVEAALAELPSATMDRCAASAVDRVLDAMLRTAEGKP